MVVNYTTSSHTSNQSRFMDSTASHHVPFDLWNLSPCSNYNSFDKLIIRDGLNLEITCASSIILFSPATSYSLCNVLCVPSIQKIIIFISKFCKTYQAYIIFFHNYFLVKDLCIGVILTRGLNDEVFMRCHP